MASSSSSSSITFLVRNPNSDSSFTLVIDSSITVAQLKDRIRRADASLTGSFELWDRIVELRDHFRICDYELASRTELQVVPRDPTPPPFVAPPEQTFVPALDPTLLSYPWDSNSTTPPAAGQANAAPPRKKTLKMKVTVYEEEEKVEMEVYPGTKVAELRRWLEKVGASKGLKLPEDGYFFIHNGNVMDEENSFRWHDFADGDTVEVFPGIITDHV